MTICWKILNHWNDKNNQLNDKNNQLNDEHLQLCNEIDYLIYDKKDLQDTIDDINSEARIAIYGAIDSKSKTYWRHYNDMDKIKAVGCIGMLTIFATKLKDEISALVSFANDGTVPQQFDELIGEVFRRSIVRHMVELEDKIEYLHSINVNYSDIPEIEEKNILTNFVELYNNA